MRISDWSSDVCSSDLDAERADAVLREREADQPAPVRRHEVDRVGGHHLRGDDEIALVLAILLVDEDEHAAVLRLVDDLFGAGEEGVALMRERGVRIGPDIAPYGVRSWRTTPEVRRVGNVWVCAVRFWCSPSLT